MEKCMRFGKGIFVLVLVFCTICFCAPIEEAATSTDAATKSPVQVTPVQEITPERVYANDLSETTYSRDPFPFYEFSFSGASLTEDDLHTLATRIGEEAFEWDDVAAQLEEYGLECAGIEELNDLHELGHRLIKKARVEMTKDNDFALIEVFGGFASAVRPSDDVNLYLIFQNDSEMYSPYIAVQFLGKNGSNNGFDDIPDYLQEMADSNWLVVSGVYDRGSGIHTKILGWYNINHAAIELKYFKEYWLSDLATRDEAFIMRTFETSVANDDETKYKDSQMLLVIDLKIEAMYFVDGYDTGEEDVLQKQFNVSLHYDKAKSAFYTHNTDALFFLWDTSWEQPTDSQIKYLFYDELKMLAKDSYPKRAEWAKEMLAQ